MRPDVDKSESGIQNPHFEESRVKTVEDFPSSGGNRALNKIPVWSNPPDLPISTREWV